MTVPPDGRGAPQRTCVQCGAKEEKGCLLRIAGRKEREWAIDPDGRREGRGIYLCRDPDCVAGFARRLRTRKGASRLGIGAGADALADALDAWMRTGSG